MVQRRRHGRTRGPKPGRSSRPKSYRIVCSGCGKEFVVPVPPPDNKKLLCMECFKKIEISSMREEFHHRAQTGGGRIDEAPRTP